MKIELPYIRRYTGRTSRQAKQKLHLVADRIVVDVAEISDDDAPLATSVRIRDTDGSYRMRSVDTRWHDGKHWITTDEDIERPDQRVARASSSLASLFVQSVYGPSIWADWNKGKMIPSSESLIDITSDNSDADHIRAIQAAMDNISVIGNRPAIVGSEPLLGIKVDNRSPKGQDQGFRERLTVELIQPHAPSPPRDHMLFRLDQIDLLHDIAGNARIVGLEDATRCASTMLDGTHVFDSWRASALGYIERRIHYFRRLLSDRGIDYVSAWCDLDESISGAFDDDGIDIAFAKIREIHGIDPDSYDTRWLTRSSYERFTGHWDTRPIETLLTSNGPDLSHTP